MLARCAAILALVLAALAPPPAAAAEWIRAESPHFVVFAQSDAEKLRRRVAELEEFHRLLRLLTGAQAPEDPPKLSIYIVDGTGGLRQVRDVSHRVAGFYDATPHGIAAFLDRHAESSINRNQVLFHEYAHHFMLQHFPAAYPSWYVEGFAEYVMTARFEDDVIEYGDANEARAYWVGDRRRWMPFERLLFGDPYAMGGDDGAKFYAQSWLLVHYLLRDAGRLRRLNRYLVAIAEGAEPRAAFSNAFGMTATELQEEVIDYAFGRGISFTRLPRLTAAEAPPIRIERMPDSADGLLLLDAAVRLGPGDRGEGYLRRIRAAAEGHDDEFARRALARIEALHGDGAAADALLDRLLAEHPDDAELLYLKGMRHLAAGRRDAGRRAEHFEAAQPWFVRAHRADPGHYQTLYRYAESLSLEPEFLSENTANVLMLAHQLAPQAWGVTLSTANLLMRRGEFQAAERLLARIAVDPHRGKLAEAAAAMMVKAKARDATGLADVFDLPKD